ncbi:MAG: glycosyltransferase 87 family protein [Candidatus Bathyarchaeia archaeon]
MDRQQNRTRKKGCGLLAQLFRDRRVLLALFLAGLFAAEAFLSMWTGLAYDMKVWFQTGVWMNEGTNIYLPADHLGYPPLWAFWCLASNHVYSLFSNSMEAWRFTVKLPMMLAQFGLAFAMAKFAESRFDKKTAQRIFLFALTWVFFIYIGALWGQLNMLSALLTFLAFYALVKGRTTVGAVLLGTAITLKIYPLVILPAFLAYVLKNRDKREALKLVLYTSAVPVVFTVTVFAAYQWDLVYFLQTIFYWTPAVEANPVLLQGGCMNLWSFTSLLNLDIASVWLLRFVWVPAVAATAVYWFRKPTMGEADLNLAIISLYFVYLLTYGFVPEQAFLDPLPFIFLQILAYRPRKPYLFMLVGVQVLVFAFSTFNWGPFIFEPLLTQFSPSLLKPLQLLNPSRSSLVWTIRGTLGLSVSLSIAAFLAVLVKPEILTAMDEKVRKRLSCAFSNR